VDNANYYGGSLNYSCATPQPDASAGNITNAPLFVDSTTGNLRLQSIRPALTPALMRIAGAIQTAMAAPHRGCYH